MGTVTQLLEVSHFGLPRGAQMLKFLIFAAHSSQAAPTTPADKGLSLEWGLILLGLAIGLAITLMPP